MKNGMNTSQAALLLAIFGVDRVVEAEDGTLEKKHFNVGPDEAVSCITNGKFPETDSERLSFQLMYGYKPRMIPNENAKERERGAQAAKMDIAKMTMTALI